MEGTLKAQELRQGMGVYCPPHHIPARHPTMELKNRDHQHVQLKGLFGSNRRTARVAAPGSRLSPAHGKGRSGVSRKPEGGLCQNCAIANQAVQAEAGGRDGENNIWQSLFHMLARQCGVRDRPTHASLLHKPNRKRPSERAGWGWVAWGYHRNKNKNSIFSLGRCIGCQLNDRRCLEDSSPAFMTFMRWEEIL